MKFGPTPPLLRFELKSSWGHAHATCYLKQGYFHHALTIRSYKQVYGTLILREWFAHESEVHVLFSLIARCYESGEYAVQTIKT